MSNYEVLYEPRTKELSLKVNVQKQYPYSDEFEYVAYMDRIDFNEEKLNDLKKNKGFIIYSPKATIKKDIKNPNGIFSTKYGQKLGDLNPYIDRWSCQCGYYKGHINKGLMCPKCGRICKYVDDDFSIFGWIEIDKEYKIINPDMYNILNSFFGRSKHPKDKKSKTGSVLQNMICYDKEIDQHGNEIGPKVKPNEPYYGIGIIEFVQRFDEILSFYYNKNKSSQSKRDLYYDIMVDKSKIFIDSIPVFTTLLRPMDIQQGNMYYEKTNKFYNMMVQLSNRINKNKRKIDRVPKLKNQQLYNLQMKYMQLYDEVIEILQDKKGQLRTLVSGRFNYTSREVIKQDPQLRIDQCKLPYVELVITLEQQICNILHKTLNISFQQAWDKWFRAIGIIDQTIVKIIEDIIKSSCGGEGLPVIINRNPTISFG